MKVKVSISEFRDALGVASLTLSKRLGAADNALLYLRAAKRPDGTGAIYFFTFDGIARTFAKISANVETEGETVINPLNLIGSLARLIREGELTLSQGDKKDQLSVTGAGRKMKFAASGDLDNFKSLLAAMPTSQAENFTIAANVFKKLIKHAAPFVDRPDKEDAADFNRGDANLLIKPVSGGYEACATEGNALAVVKVSDTTVSPNAEALKIPLPSVLNLNKMLDKMKGQQIRVIIVKGEDGDPRQIYLRTDNIFYGTALDCHPFREYERILQFPVSRRVRLPREHFLALIGNAAPFVSGLKGDANSLDLMFRSDKLRVRSGESLETYEEEVDVQPIAWPETNPEAWLLSFLPYYLSNVARVVTGDSVLLSLADNQVIAYFSSENEDVTSTYAIGRLHKQSAAALPKAA